MVGSLLVGNEVLASAEGPARKMLPIIAADESVTAADMHAWAVDRSSRRPLALVSNSPHISQ